MRQVRTYLVDAGRAAGALAALWLCAAVTNAGCVQIGTDTGDASASAPGSSGSGTLVAAVDAGSAGCATDPSTGVVLCSQVSLCPALVVDPDAFPGCGFRQPSVNPLDIECSCSGMLCPVGSPTTCEDAALLLQAQGSALLVCEQVSEGRCVAVGGASAGSTPSTNASTCDRACESECGGDPNCIQLCGC